MTNELLSLLQSRVNSQGLVLGRESVLAEDLQTTALALEGALDNLERQGQVEVLSGPPFLVLRLRVWPGKDGSPTENRGPERAVHSFKAMPSRSTRLNESHSYSQYPLDQGLLQEILTTLGETDPATFRQAVTHFPPEAIRATLERIHATAHFRKSRTATFRFLLPRIAKEQFSH
jgi:hypothetical protein